MAFLKSLPEVATLLDSFQHHPQLARPLLAYQQTVMRGSSPLTEAQRELIAAYVAGLEACDYARDVHGAAAVALGAGEGWVELLLRDLDTAPVDDRLKSLLRYVRKLTLTPSRLGPADAAAVRAVGWDDRALLDAVTVGALASLIDRLVLGLGVQAGDGYARTAGDRLAEIGYLGLLDLLPSPSED